MKTTRFILTLLLATLLLMRPFRATASVSFPMVAKDPTSGQASSTKELPASTKSSIRQNGDLKADNGENKWGIQILSLRNCDAGKILEFLRFLLPANSSITANQANNSIIIQDTMANIRLVSRVVKASEEQELKRLMMLRRQ